MRIAADICSCTTTFSHNLKQKAMETKTANRLLEDLNSLYSSKVFYHITPKTNEDDPDDVTIDITLNDSQYGIMYQPWQLFSILGMYERLNLADCWVDTNDFRIHIY